jgi:ATP-dependent RNA helicase DDX51/DBP6
LRRLRALVLVPTRELVSQVYNVFKGLIKGMNLRCEALYGDKSFAEEQSRLVNAESGDSLVDIVICTPGRLVDHLQSTPGFTLQHLRFLVADEADRLLMQSYQDWLAKVRSLQNRSTKFFSLIKIFPRSGPRRIAHQAHWSHLLF